MLFLVMIAVIPLWLFFTGGFWEILFPEQKKLEEAFAEHIFRNKNSILFLAAANII